MTSDEFEGWALSKAREIVSREGAELALRARELDIDAVEADATLLGAAIAKALIEAFEMGQKG
jgi:hypothetical protein